jgi:hypothetical protein
MAARLTSAARRVAHGGGQRMCVGAGSQARAMPVCGELTVQGHETHDDAGALHLAAGATMTIDVALVPLLDDG